MSGFDKDWLALREPVDLRARASTLVEAISGHLERVGQATILDIGCGTGSTWRSLTTHVPDDTRWTLLDYDPLLLAEAERRIGVTDTVSYRQFDLNEVQSLPLSDVTLVTASALFDLCSADFCTRFAQTLSRSRTGLYAALNYDGVMAWTIKHPLDGQVAADFNRHQGFDKGFGPALGPDATEHLRHCFEGLDYSISVGTSPWTMGTDDAALQTAFLEGLKKPLTEIGNLTRQDIRSWMDFRLEKIADAGSSCVVGHTDILALPHRRAG